MPFNCRLLSCLTVIAGVLVAPKGALAAALIPHISEPLLFDMVRGLGAKAGESEINTLVQITGDDVDWAPEAEWVPFDGHAIEFELPGRNGQLQHLKFAYQGTFGTFLDGQGIHGVQTIVKRQLRGPKADLSALYLAGIRFSPVWSTLLMGGAQWDTGFGLPALLANTSVFADITGQFLVGLEINSRREPNGNLEMVFLPQARWDFEERYHLQFGMGAALDEGLLRPTSALRVSIDF